MSKQTLTQRVSALKERIGADRLRWYNVVIGEAFEESDEDSSEKAVLLRSAIREMGVHSQIGAVQGTAFEYIHCTEPQMIQLAEKSGFDSSCFVELNWQMARFLRLRDPRLLRKMAEAGGIRPPDSPTF